MRKSRALPTDASSIPVIDKRDPDETLGYNSNGS